MFILTSLPINPQSLKENLVNPSVGATVCFEGIVRNNNDGKTVSSLIYEANETLANKETNNIIKEAHQKFSIIKALACHRVGTLSVLDIAVWVGVSAAHRDEAFLACRYIIDEIKKRVPIWKKEFFMDGTTHWVNSNN